MQCAAGEKRAAYQRLFYSSGEDVRLDKCRGIFSRSLLTDKGNPDSCIRSISSRPVLSGASPGPPSSQQSNIGLPDEETSGDPVRLTAGQRQHSPLSHARSQSSRYITRHRTDPSIAVLIWLLQSSPQVSLGSGESVFNCFGFNCPVGSRLDMASAYIIESQANGNDCLAQLRDWSYGW